MFDNIFHRMHLTYLCNKIISDSNPTYISQEHFPYCHVYLFHLTLRILINPYIHLNLQNIYQQLHHSRRKIYSAYQKEQPTGQIDWLKQIFWLRIHAYDGGVTHESSYIHCFYPDKFYESKNCGYDHVRNGVTSHCSLILQY